MAQTEIIIESMNPCGGKEHSDVRILEADVQDPFAFVRQNTDEGEIMQEVTEDGAVCITWNKNGYIKRFIFSGE